MPVFPQQEKIQLLLTTADQLETLLLKENASFKIEINFKELLFPYVGSFHTSMAVDEWLLYKVLNSQALVKKDQLTSEEQSSQNIDYIFLRHLAFGWSEKYSIEQAMELIAQSKKPEKLSSSEYENILLRHISFVMGLVLFDTHNRFIFSNKFNANFKQFIEIIEKIERLGEVTYLLNGLYEAKRQCNLQILLKEVEESSKGKNVAEIKLETLDYTLKKEYSEILQEKIAKETNQFFITKLLTTKPERYNSNKTDDASSLSLITLADLSKIHSIVSMRVSYSILSQYEKAEVTAAIDFWIKVAELLQKKYTNYEAALAVILGVSNYTVTRMRPFKDANNKQIFDNLAELFAPGNNYENLKAHIHKTKEGHLPLAYLTRTKTFNEDRYDNEISSLVGMGQSNFMLISIQYRVHANYAKEYFGGDYPSTNISTWITPLLDDNDLVGSLLYRKSCELDPGIINLATITAENLIISLKCFAKGKDKLAVIDPKTNTEDNTFGTDDSLFNTITGYKAANLILKHLKNSNWPKEIIREIIVQLDNIFKTGFYNVKKLSLFEAIDKSNYFKKKNKLAKLDIEPAGAQKADLNDKSPSPASSNSYL